MLYPHNTSGTDDKKYVYDVEDGSPIAMQLAAFREQYVERFMVANPLMQVNTVWA